MEDALQVAGALLILVAFVAHQRGVLGSHTRAYLALNLVGSVLLAVLALLDRDWGFLLLEAVWAAMSAWSLGQVLRGREPATAS